MADIRIKDLATTATTTASDDFMAVDGAINGTRKLSAAAPAFLTSVTTPSLTSPASTDLTLAGGSSGASLVLGQGSSGFGTLTTTAANQQLQLKGGASYHEGLIFSESATPLSDTNAAMLYAGPSSYLSGTAYGAGVALTPGVPFFRISRHNNLNNAATAELLRVVQSTGNLLIGTTSETGLTGGGGLKIASTTAGASNAGALVVTGGLATGAASYFGGAVTIGGSANLSIQSGAGLFLDGGSNTYIVENAADSVQVKAGNITALTTTSALTTVNGNLTVSGTGTSTFAGAVTIAGTVIHTLSATPASASATGTVGTMSWDASYIYICTAANTWKRVAIATW